MTSDSIDQIEANLASLDAQIERLKQEREAVLESDEEYSSYLDQFQHYYPDDTPLTIRGYYDCVEELHELNRLFGQEFVQGRDIEELMRQYGTRLYELERMLAA
jgi:hypothetical protein